MLPAAGDAFDRYLIEATLGEGGMGRVFRAYDPRLKRNVALKIVREARDDERRRKLLLHEACAAAALDHPNVVSIFDVGEFSGTAFVAMEHVEGRLLRDFVGDASIPTATRIRWLADIARALAAAHARGLVHRDVKPTNVMVRGDGVVKVLDFGIARRVRFVARGDESAATLTGDDDELVFETVAGSGEDRSLSATLASLTAAGHVVGTPLYMAPEQMRGEAVDARADQFAWGVVAYELLAGEKPWGADTTLPTIAAVLSQPVPPLALRAPEVPATVAAVVERALSKRREDRLASMEDVVAQLGDARSSPAPRSDRRRGAGRAAWIAGGSAVVLAGATAAFSIPARRAGDASIPSATESPAAIEPTAVPTPTPPVSTAQVAPPSSVAASPPLARPPASIAQAPLPPRAPASSTASAGASATTVASTSAPALRCDPNFELDQNGEKRFKPECFPPARQSP